MPAGEQACWCIQEPDRAEAQRTFVVLGIVHGGTSMIAGLLRLLGIYMGPNLDSTHENKEFRDALLGDRTRLDRCLAPLRIFTSYRPLVARYNREHAVWGVKDPLLTYYLPLLARYWRNPAYILVLRNLAAAAASQARHFQRPFDKRLAKVLAGYRWLYRFASRSNRPLLVIDYEAAVYGREAVVGALADFCGIALDEERRAAALAFMDQSRGYQWLLDGNTASLVGFVEQTAASQVSGWAFNPRSEEPVTLALLHDGVEIARTTAHHSRPDVQSNGSFARLACGFVFDLVRDRPLRAESIQVVDVASGAVLKRVRAM